MRALPPLPDLARARRAPGIDRWQQGRSATAALGRALDAAFSARVASWQDRLEQLKDKGKRVVAWGAGAKSTTFLNIVDPAGSIILHVVDINPRKTGRFVPGSGQEIVEPNSLRELHPDVIILM